MIYNIIVAIVTIIAIYAAYMIGYKNGVTDMTETLNDNLTEQYEALEAEKKRLAEGVDSGLI